MLSQADIALIDSIFNNPTNRAVFIALLVWSLIWKGFALWKSARNGQRNWFIAMLVVNTIGILEIIYLFYFSKKKTEKIAKII